MTSGITMWIVLIVLVIGVVGFLVVTSVIDKKKRKKERVEVLRREEEAQDAVGQVAIWISLIVQYHSEKLKNFVVSVGDFTMSELNKVAKQQLTVVRKSPLFKKLYGDRELAGEYEAHINNIMSVKSNNWEKKVAADINFFIDEVVKAKKDESALLRLEHFTFNQAQSLNKIFKVKSINFPKPDPLPQDDLEEKPKKTKSKKSKTKTKKDKKITKKPAK